MRHIDRTLGQLVPHHDGKLDCVVGTSHEIWVPSEVERLPFPRYHYYPTWAELPAVAFPIPYQRAEGRPYKPEPFYPKPGVEPYLYLTTGYCDPCHGYEPQWQRKTDTAYLLNAFLKLAAYEEISEKACKEVGKFAKQWGPLWRCRGIGHNFIFPHCYIFLHSLVSFHYRETCGWIPIELIQEYLTEAQRAKGVIDACLKLRESQHVHESVWRKIYKKASPEPEIAARCEAVIQRHAAPRSGLSTEHNIQQYHLHWNSSPEQGVRFGWSLLIDLINYHIAQSGGLAPCLVDDSTRQGPQLRIAAQWGFLPAVWSEIAQTISGVHQFYCCDECRRFYQRTGRKPKEGQNNYCPGCREAGHKGSKKDSKARKRLRRKDV